MDELTLQRINLLPRAQALSAGDSVFSDEERQFIAEIYKSLLGKDIPNCSCRNRFTDALIEICSTFKIKLNMSKCQYQLLAGVIIWLGTECYSNHNLTDEVAEEYLRRFPEAREKEFQVWPEEEPQAKENAEAVIEEAKKILNESTEALRESEGEITEESVQRIIACQNTLEEVIDGGCIVNIEAATEGLKQAWGHAERKPEPAQDPADNGEGQGEGDPDPDQGEDNGEGEGDGDNGQNQDPDPEPEPAKPSKTKKGK